MVAHWHRGRLPLLKLAGLPPLTFHELRHTFASLAFAAREHPGMVQKILGHSSIVQTMDTYSHLAPAWPTTRPSVSGATSSVASGYRPVLIIGAFSYWTGAERGAAKRKTPALQGVRGALGRTRTCDLLIRSQIQGALPMRIYRIGKPISVR